MSRWCSIVLGLVPTLLACTARDGLTPSGDTLELDGTDVPGESSDSDGESSETGTPDSFDPLTCASWDPPEATSPGTPPPEQDCPLDSACPVFRDVTLVAGLDTQHYVSTHPFDRDCIFPKRTQSGVSPNIDCEPQWFTGGVSVADVDEDGWPDVFMTRLAAPDHLFLNQGDGTFVDVAVEVGLGACSYTNGSVFGDIDNDGDQDLLVTGLGSERHYLWVNQLVETGSLGFVEQGEARGFASASSVPHSGQSVTLGDFDRDGWLDAHVNEWLRTYQFPAEPELASLHGARLLHNLGGGSFEDVTELYDVDMIGVDEDGVFAYSSTFVDLDGDGWQDLALAVDFHDSRLFWNLAGATYLDGTMLAGVNAESNAMGSTFGDVDGDGWLDWYVTSIAELDDECEPGEAPPCWSASGNRLYRYQGSRTFERLEDVAGVRDGAWAWGTAWFDLDNDGDQDLVLANGWPGRDLNGGFYHADTPMRLWINHGPGVPMTEEGSARGVDDRQQGRGLVTFDYDRDGDLDLLVANHAGRPLLLRNEGGNRQHWLRVEVEGVGSNRDGRGAKLRVQALPDGDWQVREVGVGSHFLGEGELIHHFGLGEAEAVHRLEIEWPRTGVVQGFDEVAADQVVHVIEPE